MRFLRNNPMAPWRRTRHSPLTVAPFFFRSILAIGSFFAILDAFNNGASKPQPPRLARPRLSVG